MVANSKPYMNFLGGEVSPNAYKRLDMANNGKWFETAKNIYFGTTGDFQNRRGFIHIGQLPNKQAAGEKLKLIPFVFNREQSYCIAFYANGFSILKDGAFLLDENNQPIVVEHPGMSFSNIDDISYCQIGDIVYIASSSQNGIFTITRKADKVWEWGTFDYEIPPMCSNNEDSLKELSFSADAVIQTGYRSTVILNTVGGTFGDVTITLKYPGAGGVIQSIPLAQSSGTFSTLAQLASFFNANNDRIDLVDECVAEGDRLVFSCKEAAYTLSENFYISVNVGNGNCELRSIDSYYTASGYTSGNTNVVQYYYALDENVLIRTATLRYKTNMNTYDVEHLYTTPLTRAQFITAVDTEAKTYLNNYTYMAANDAASVKTYSYGPRQMQGGAYIPDKAFTYTYILSCEYIYPISGAVEYVSSAPEALYTNLSSVYLVNASFDFFADKKEGDVFSVDSIYSPSKDGKAGENKSYYSASIAAGETITDSFWSNGNWRIVTSGLFAGAIELQYSYDGTHWYTHRTFSSSIRTENNVSYGTNYNEYGTIDVDDNVLLRLRINITSQANLTILLDTESFKNRSYYKVVQKTNDTTAIVECIKYNVGTPGITKYNTSTQTYDINPIDEWAEAAWSTTNGFPKKTFFYQNRLAFANTNKEPYAIWFSRTDNFKDFSTKLEYTDDDPITIQALRATGVSEINTVASAKKLFVFTADHEEGIADEGAMTQANKQLLGFTYYGSEPIETRNVSNKIIFIERGGRAARALTYDFSQDNYEASDLTIPYKHLLKEERIVATEYIPGDYKTFLMLTSSGRLICFKYLPEQRIEACSWFRHANGNITNICVVNVKDGCDLYIAINSGTKKFVEYLSIKEGLNLFYLDSYKEYNLESASNSVTDADYFIPGTEYTIIAEDGIHKATADNTGTIALPAAMTDFAVGVSYVSEATLIEPNLLYQNGTTNYNRRNMYKAFFTYVDSVGFKVGVKNKERSFKQVFSLPLISIDVEREKASGERNFILQSSYLEPNMLSFVQEEPYPMHITNAEVEVDYGGK